MLISGVYGRKLRHKPATTSTMGYATFILLASTINEAIAMIRKR